VLEKENLQKEYKEKSKGIVSSNLNLWKEINAETTKNFLQMNLELEKQFQNATKLYEQMQNSRLLVRKQSISLQQLLLNTNILLKIHFALPFKKNKDAFLLLSNSLHNNFKSLQEQLQASKNAFLAIPQDFYSQIKLLPFQTQFDALALKKDHDFSLLQTQHSTLTTQYDQALLSLADSNRQLELLRSQHAALKGSFEHLQRQLSESNASNALLTEELRPVREEHAKLLMEEKKRQEEQKRAEEALGGEAIVHAFERNTNVLYLISAKEEKSSQRIEMKNGKFQAYCVTISVGERI